MPYNPEIHRRRAVRLKGYDYSQAGLYFITICTRVGTQHVVSLQDNQETSVGTSHVMSLHGTTPNPASPNHPLGKIVDGEMILNDVGKIADEYLQNIPNHFSHAEMGEYVVMPNHVHCILVLNTPSVGTRHVVSLPDNPEISVGTSHVMSLPSASKHLNQFSKPIPGSVSVIVQQYKSSVKRWCNKNNHVNFQWQSRFHDHIIRTAKSYQNISQYIINNPKTWKEDKFYSE